jgi:hypothetical protein
MDPQNPIVKLCARGMESEAKGDYEGASAWEQSTNDFERCIAAHYVARHQASPEETLNWNQLSLQHARAVGDEKCHRFLPVSLSEYGQSMRGFGKVG